MREEKDEKDTLVDLENTTCDDVAFLTAFGTTHGNGCHGHSETIYF